MWVVDVGRETNALKKKLGSKLTHSTLCTTQLPLLPPHPKREGKDWTGRALFFFIFFKVSVDLFFYFSHS